MKMTQKFSKWEKLIIAVGCKLSWYDSYVSKGDHRGIHVVVCMDRSSYDELSNEEEIFEDIRDSLLIGEEEYVETVCDFAYALKSGDVFRFSNIKTRFYMWGEGSVLKVGVNESLLSKKMANRRLAVLN